MGESVSRPSLSAWAYLLTGLVVLVLASLGRFRSAALFPLVFGTAWFILGVLQLRAARRLSQALWPLVIGVLLAAAIPLGHHLRLELDRSRIEEHAMARLAGRPAPPLVFDYGIPKAATGAIDPSNSIVVLNFWATWCTPCVKEMPVLEAFFQRHQAEIELVGATRLYETAAGQDPSVELARISSFLEERGVTYPVIVNDSDDLFEAFAIASLPTTVLIDRGAVVLYGIGQDGAEAVLREAERLAAGV